MREQWEYRADLAESAISERHLRPLMGLPGTQLGVVTWPPRMREKLFVQWHFWWQAHLIDCAVDAYQRRSTPSRARVVKSLVAGHRRRSTGGWTANNYYDDLAWLGLAVGRAQRVPGVSDRRVRRAYHRVIDDLVVGINPHFGVVPWRRGDMFFNAPANAPTALLFAREGRQDLSVQMLRWMEDNLLDPELGLIRDGIRIDQADEPVMVPAIYSYNQGVILGVLLELARQERRIGQRDKAAVYEGQVRQLVHAIAAHLTDDFGVINTEPGDGGDGGLFKGILARYVADVVTQLPEDSEDNHTTREIARRVVMASAESVWRHRLEVDGLPLFGADWTGDAQFPQATGLVATSVGGAVASSSVAERDLSVQLSGWMLMEAACRVRQTPRADSEKRA